MISLFADEIAVGVFIYRIIFATNSFTVCIYYIVICFSRAYRKANAVRTAVGEVYILILTAAANNIAAFVIYGRKIIVLGAYQACIFKYKAFLIDRVTLFAGARYKLPTALRVIQTVKYG